MNIGGTRHVINYVAIFGCYAYLRMNPVRLVLKLDGSIVIYCDTVFGGVLGVYVCEPTDEVNLDCVWHESLLLYFYHSNVLMVGRF
jgi:hypothetical protein